MRSRKVPSTKSKGQSPESLVFGPLSVVRGSQSIVYGLVSKVIPGAALLALVCFAGCDLLNLFDTTGPTCELTSPADSAGVNGVVTIAATATDSGGMDYVNFYVDNTLVGTDTSSPYSASWDASGLAERTWHSVYCIARDLAGNRGYSDTIQVEITGVGQTSVFHGEVEVIRGTASSIPFDAAASDTLSGEVQVVTGGTLTQFVWLDQENYQKFVNAQSYTALFEQKNFTQVSLTQAVPAAGRYYLAFANGGTATVKCWVRFVLK